MFDTMKLTEVAKLPGVADLKGKCRMNFVLALRDEARGDHAKAAERLDKAIVCEAA